VGSNNSPADSASVRPQIGNWNVVTEDELLAYAAHTLGSIWALDLLLLLKRDPAHGWNRPSLVRELRSSSIVIHEALEKLRAAGLSITDSAGLNRYHPASPQLDDVVCELERIYAQKPFTVITAIGATRHE
jgi:hypothetical protein